MTDIKDTNYDEQGPPGSGFADKDTSTSFSLLRMLVPRSSSSRRGISACSSNSERRVPSPAASALNVAKIDPEECTT